MSEKSVRLTLRERDLRTLLGTLRGRIEEYESDLDDAVEDEVREWYEERLAEMRPLARRLNSLGLRHFSEVCSAGEP